MEDASAAVALFERHRSQLRGVAYRLLGSFADVDDVLQDAWLRFRSVDPDGLDNPAAWLTTVVGRLSLNRLRDRARTADGSRFPDVVVEPFDRADPERSALLRDRLGVALLVVLDTLGPDERVAFVLHDVLAVPFEPVAAVLGTTAPAARQLASRARRRIGPPATEAVRDPRRERAAVDAFLAATERGDVDALLAVLHPAAVLRSDGGSVRSVLRGGADIARSATRFGGLSRTAAAVLVNGVPGVVAAPRGAPVSLMAFEVRDGLITAIDVLSDPARLRALVAAPRVRAAGPPEDLSER